MWQKKPPKSSLKRNLHCQKKQEISKGFTRLSRKGANSLSLVKHQERARERRVAWLQKVLRQYPKNRNQVQHLEIFSFPLWVDFLMLLNSKRSAMLVKKPTPCKHPTAHTRQWHGSELWNPSDDSPKVQQWSSLCFPRTQTTFSKLCTEWDCHV